MKAKVYGSSHCVWCDRVAKMLEDSGADIEKVDVSQGKEIIKECPGWLFQFPTENPVKAEML